MNEILQYRIYSIFGALAACMVASIVFAVWRRARRSSHEALAWCLAAILWTLVSNLFEILSPTFRSTLFWSLVGYAGLVSIPPLNFLFVLGYTGRGRGRAKFLAFVVPVITLALLYTNSFHSLHWASIGYRKVGRFSALVLSYGPWFWVLIVHQYALLLGGMAIVAVDFFASRRFYSRQAFWVVLGAAVPLAFNFLYVLRLIPGVTKDFTPVAFAFSGLAFAVGVRRYRLFEMAPVTYRAAFDAMADSVFIVDPDGLLMDYNAATAGFFDLTHDALGGPAAEIPALQSAILSAKQSDSVQKPSDFSIEVDGKMRWFEAISHTLEPGGGLLYSLRDVTERRAMFMEKSELVDRLTVANAEINDLRGIVPICAKCKKMRDDEGYWHQVESYFAVRSDLRFSHGLCPECAADTLSELDGMITIRTKREK